jgi:hypothetical protein
MSAIKVNNFPFRGINTNHGERTMRNFNKEIAFSYNSTKSTQKIFEKPIEKTQKLSLPASRKSHIVL